MHVKRFLADRQLRPLIVVSNDNFLDLVAVFLLDFLYSIEAFVGEKLEKNDGNVRFSFPFRITSTKRKASSRKLKSPKMTKGTVWP